MFKKRIIEKLKNFNKEDYKNKLNDELIQELTHYFENKLTKVCKEEDSIVFLSTTTYKEHINDFHDGSENIIELPELKGYLL